MSMKERVSGGRLLVVSNRLPVAVAFEGGSLRARRTIGGLASALTSVAERAEMLWVGWPGMHTDDAAQRSEIGSRLASDFGCLPVFIPHDLFDKFYQGFSNNCLWPLFHYFPRLANYEPDEWQAYRAVNELYCQRVIEVARPGDRIWVHDYQLMLLPNLLRRALPDEAIGFFLHIPFPTYEIFRDLPWREQLLRGVLGADLIGFHTYDYMRHFLSSLLRLLGLEHDLGQIGVGSRLARADTFPLGVDTPHLAELAADPQVLAQTSELAGKFKTQKTILSVDRLDFTKGIPARLLAFERFLDRHPDWLGKVRLVLICVPSRTEVPAYQKLKGQVDELVGRVNGKFGALDWQPVWYLYRGFSTNELAGFYRYSDVAMVTPLRDGMNLIAKEYLACRVDDSGVLILSETAGASGELGEALLVNPNDLDGMADAIEAALTMPGEEQARRNRPMRERLRRYDSARWADDFLSRLDETLSLQTSRRRRLDDARRAELLAQYQSAQRRLLLLDYDGTLTPIVSLPGQAGPDTELKGLILRLTESPRSTAVVISGRDHRTLEGWLGGLGLTLVAEHGAWLSDRNGKNWRMIEAEGGSDWKAVIRPVLETYVDRTPGSLVEEKSLALVWHYRMADPELGSLRAKELADTLASFVANTALHVLHGSKVLEIKDSGVGKGKAAMRWLNATPPPDFVLAIGDDETDEDMFEALPAEAWTVRVGHALHTRARFYLDGPSEVRDLLQQLAALDGKA